MKEYKISLLTYVTADNEHEAEAKSIKALEQEIADGNIDIELVKQNTPLFGVGEYYSFTTYRIDYDADTTFIFKVLRIKGSGIRVIEYDIHGEELSEYVYDIDSDFLKKSTPATAEQTAKFKRAEQFASKGRKLDEFRVGDLINCSKIPADNGYFTGDLVINKIGNAMFTAATNYGLRAYYLRDLSILWRSRL